MNIDFAMFWGAVGIVALVLAVLTVAMVLLKWLCWLFNWGRFMPAAPLSGATQGPAAAPEAPRVGFILTDLVVKIINEFRHLLALIIVAIFALALAYVLFASDTVRQMREGLETVVATLGGLVGSIIGYYFGESTTVAPTPPPPAPVVLTPPAPAVAITATPLPNAAQGGPP